MKKFVHLPDDGNFMPVLLNAILRILWLLYTISLVARCKCWQLCYVDSESKEWLYFVFVFFLSLDVFVFLSKTLLLLELLPTTLLSLTHRCLRRHEPPSTIILLLPNGPFLRQGILGPINSPISLFFSHFQSWRKSFFLLITTCGSPPSQIHFLVKSSKDKQFNFDNENRWITPLRKKPRQFPPPSSLSSLYLRPKKSIVWVRNNDLW